MSSDTPENKPQTVTHEADPDDLDVDELRSRYSRGLFYNDRTPASRALGEGPSVAEPGATGRPTR
jgi:hypothetical protein